MKFARKLIHGGPVHLCHRPVLLSMARPPVAATVKEESVRALEKEKKK